jgi:hypothetical protein
MHPIQRALQELDELKADWESLDSELYWKYELADNPADMNSEEAEKLRIKLRDTKQRIEKLEEEVYQDNK